MKKTISIAGLLLIAILLFGCASNKYKIISPTKNGKLHGLYKEYNNKTGKIVYSAQYVNGKKNGIASSYSVGGYLVRTDTYVNDIKHGLVAYYTWLDWNKKTQYILRTDTYENGIKSGPQTTYGRDGSIHQVFEYENGILKNTKKIKQMRKKWTAEDKARRASYNSSNGFSSNKHKEGTRLRACRYVKNYNNLMTPNANLLSDAITVCKHGWMQGYRVIYPL